MSNERIHFEIAMETIPGMNRLINKDYSYLNSQVQEAFFKSGLENPSTIITILEKLFINENLNGIEKNIIKGIIKDTAVIKNLRTNLGSEKTSTLLKFIYILIVRSDIMKVLDNTSQFTLETVNGKSSLIESFDEIGEQAMGPNHRTYKVGELKLSLENYYICHNALEEQDYLVNKSLKQEGVPLHDIFEHSYEHSGLHFLWNKNKILIFFEESSFTSFDHSIEQLDSVKILDNFDDNSVLLQMGDKHLYKLFVEDGQIKRELVLESNEEILKINKVYHVNGDSIIQCKTEEGSKYYIGGKDPHCLNPDSIADKVVHTSHFFALRTRNGNGTKKLEIIVGGEIKTVVDEGIIDFIGNKDGLNVFTSYNNGEGQIYVIDFGGSVDVIDVGGVDSMDMFTHNYKAKNIESGEEEEKTEQFLQINKGNNISLYEIDLGEAEMDFSTPAMKFNIEKLKPYDCIENYGFKFFESEGKLILYAGKIGKVPSPLLQEDMFDFKIYTPNKETGKFERICKNEMMTIPGSIRVDNIGVHIEPKDFTHLDGINKNEADYFVKNIKGRSAKFTFGTLSKRGKLAWIGKILESIKKHYP